MKYLMQIFASLLFISFITKKEDKITIWMAGDSTMSVKAVKAYPETGWGMPFAHMFDSSVTINNLAKNGRSTKTFISENLWQTIKDGLQEGDYVFIQFGHNDESKEKKERYTSPDDYRKNLKKFIDETKVAGAHPVLLTPVSRRKFDDDGKAMQTHLEYSTIVRELAASEDVHFIDLDALSLELYQSMGVENSKLLFLQLKPGEHPNYPKGKTDNTHFNELGARLIAQLVLASVKENIPGLAERIVKKN